MLQVVSRGTELGREMIQIQREIDLLQLKLSSLAAEFAQTEQWWEEGSNTAIDWIRFNCK